MKKNYDLQIRLLLAACILFFLSSCGIHLSVEKRKYRDEFHADWLSKPEFLQMQNPASQIWIRNNDLPDRKWFFTPSVQSAPEEFNALTKIKSFPVKIIFLKQDTIPQKEKKKKPGPFKDKTGNNLVEYNKHSVVGFLLSLIAAGLVFYYMVISFPLALIGLVLCVIGQRKIKKQPNKYEGEFFAETGIVFSLIILLFILPVALIISIWGI